MVKKKELKNWKHVTPDMMSEDEDNNSELIRHSPLWRSQPLNQFLKNLKPDSNSSTRRLLQNLDLMVLKRMSPLL